jgi:hypothetical protein
MNEYEKAYNEINGFADIMIRLNEKGIRTHKKVMNVVSARMIKMNLQHLKKLVERENNNVRSK